MVVILVVGGVGGGYNQDQSTSAEWALAPSCDLWPASVPKTQILLTIASCSTWITVIFKHQQALQLATGDVADTREMRGRQVLGIQVKARKGERLEKVGVKQENQMTEEKTR